MFGFKLLSSGKLYRYIAFKIIKNKNKYNHKFIDKISKEITLNKLSSYNLYLPEITNLSSIIAKKKYVMWIPGDNSHQGNEIKKIIANINNYDFVTTYYTNVKKRNFFRRWFTRVYTPFLNFIFRLDLPYYNGLTVYKTVLLQNLKINTDSFTFQIEIFVNLIKKNKCNYTFVPTLLSDRDEGSSKAFNIKNVFMVLKSIMLIFFNIYFNKF